MNMESTSKEFGGFLDLEIGRQRIAYHKDAIALSHGRACLAYILDQEKPRIVHVPFYSCGAMIDPIEERSIDISYYAVSGALDPVGLPDTIASDELIIYINYFGLKSETMKCLTSQYGRRLVADNCMSFFSRQYGDSYTFNSCRKFFGVPDGSYLYTPDPVIQQFERYNRYRCDHLISRLGGKMDVCYGEFRANEDAFDCNIYAMSLFTERLMESIDYDAVADRRRQNFLYIHNHLGEFNRLQLMLEPLAIPHYYPLLVDKAPDRISMAQNKLFIPTLWPDMLGRPHLDFEYEFDLVNNVLPLPVDQRYTLDDMEQMIDVLKKYWIPCKN